MAAQTASARANLGDLPNELKTKIAQLCADQDEHFRRWTKPLYDQYASDDRFKALARTHGHSISALFRTSKEWSRLVAPFRFKVLKVSRTNNAVFSYYVAFRRITHFTTLILDEAPASTYDAFFPILGQLTNVTSVVFRQSAYDALKAGAPSYWSLSSTSAELETRSGAAMTAVKSVLLRATRLEVDVKRQKTAASILRQAPRVRSLCLQIDCLEADPTDFFALISTVSATLEELELHGSKLPDSRTPPLPYLELPTLRRLTFQVFELQPFIFRLSALFAKSLEHLRIALETAPDDPDPWDAYRENMDTFPHVQRLELAGSSWAMTEITPAITPETFPSIRRLYCEWLDSVSPARTRSPNDAYVLARLFLRAKDHPIEEVRLMDPIEPSWPSAYRAVAAWKLPAGRRITLDPNDSCPSSAILVDWKTDDWVKHA
ncbi:hypothetical protein JCM10450v2_008201 [Rhodotorula kratochvilovae]